MMALRFFKVVTLALTLPLKLNLYLIGNIYKLSSKLLYIFIHIISIYYLNTFNLHNTVKLLFSPLFKSKPLEIQIQDCQCLWLGLPYVLVLLVRCFSIIITSTLFTLKSTQTWMLVSCSPGPFPPA